MKKILFILVCLIMITGCTKKDEESSSFSSNDALSEAYNKVETFLNGSYDIYENFTGYSLDDDRVIVYLVDDSEDKQQEFLDKAKVDSKYIEFRQGNKARSSSLKELSFRIYKPCFHHDNTFDLYYEGERNIYTSSRVGEFYVTLNGVEKTLKEYIEEAEVNTIIDKVLKNMKLEVSLWDGGSAAYSLKEKDIKIIACNRINGNKNIYIGSYSTDEDITICSE